MQLTHADLKRASRAHILSDEQADTLWKFLEKHRKAPRPLIERGDLPYWLGGMAALGAMIALMAYAWSDGWGGAVLSGTYTLGLFWLANHLIHELRRTGSGAVLVILGIAFAPVGVFGFIQGSDLWTPSAPHRDYLVLLDPRWLAIEGLTLVVALAALFVFRLPVLVLPPLLCAYVSLLDLTPAMSGDPWPHATRLSWGFGFTIMIAAFGVDFSWRREPDFGRWMHGFGALMMAVALFLPCARGQLALGVVGLAMVVLVVWGALLDRGTYAVAGTLAFFGSTLWAAHHELQSSSLVALVAVALVAMALGLGVVWHRKVDQVAALRASVLPGWLRRTLGDAPGH